MKELFAKCGFNCRQCASYKKNLKTKKDRQRCSDGWFQYFGFRLTPGKLVRCDGCQPIKGGKGNRYTNCVIRKCAVQNNVETCGHCTEFENCMKKYTVISCHFTRENVEAGLGKKVTEKAYRAFIEPYENCRHLYEIRAKLRPKDIVKPDEVKARIIIADFPEKVTGTTKERASFKKLHTLLSTLISIKGKTFAQHEVLKKKRGRYFLELLWTFGLFGKYKRTGGVHLILDGKIYEDRKLKGNYERIKQYIKMMRKFGIRCEFVILSKEKYGKKGWLTPMGWVRGMGWEMKMSFSDKVGGTALIKPLQKYVMFLDKKYSKRAFRYFLRADMSVLTEKKGK